MLLEAKRKKLSAPTCKLKSSVRCLSTNCRIGLILRKSIFAVHHLGDIQRIHFLLNCSEHQIYLSEQFIFELYEKEGWYTVNVYLCSKCGHVAEQHRSRHGLLMSLFTILNSYLLFQFRLLLLGFIFCQLKRGKNVSIPHDQLFGGVSF